MPSTTTRSPGANPSVTIHIEPTRSPTFRSCAASAVVLTILVTLIVTAILRTVDVRKEITR